MSRLEGSLVLQISSGLLLRSHPSDLARPKTLTSIVTKKEGQLSVASVASQTESKTDRRAADVVAKLADLVEERNKQISRFTLSYPSVKLPIDLQPRWMTQSLMMMQ